MGAQETPKEKLRKAPFCGGRMSTPIGTVPHGETPETSAYYFSSYILSRPLTRGINVATTATRIAASMTAPV
ncbi:hypothetical protein MKOR_01500 [Mycolicibacillus koreensis]|nr:hypothetical protein MKOR_01500 [Mycolicibacillus koreensis]